MQGIKCNKSLKKFESFSYFGSKISSKEKLKREFVELENFTRHFETGKYQKLYKILLFHFDV
jgi:hypothetical protein